jgi:hypothetical protein
MEKAVEQVSETLGLIEPTLRAKAVEFDDLWRIEAGD